MARLARIVVPGVPNYIVQRGNRQLDTFFTEGDYQQYLYLMADWCNRCDVQVWAYCLMPNHVHLIGVAQSEDGLRRGVGEAHRRYTRYINGRNGWKGHLWQGRFASCPVNESYVVAAARHILMNPVRAGLVKQPGNYRWSSCRAHLEGKNDILVRVSPLAALVSDWSELLAVAAEQESDSTIRRHENTGRPLGDEGFIEMLEKQTLRTLKKQKTGPRKKSVNPEL